MALHQHPQRCGGRREEGETLQPVPPVSRRSAENLHYLPGAISREDDPATVHHGSDTHTHTHFKQKILSTLDSKQVQHIFYSQMSQMTMTKQMMKQRWTSFTLDSFRYFLTKLNLTFLRLKCKMLMRQNRRISIELLIWLHCIFKPYLKVLSLYINRGRCLHS